MLKDCNPQANLPQDDKLSSPDATESPCEALIQTPTSTLRLVVSNVISNAIPVAPQKSEPIRSTDFVAKVRKRSPYNFVLAARDYFHYLNCDVSLALEENEKSKVAPVSVIAEFLPICDDALADFIDGDEELLGMILIQFHMQVLRNLLLFCLSHEAKTLMICINEHQARELRIYDDFIKRVDEISIKNEIAIRLEIPVHAKALNQCDDLIDGIVNKFRKMLWEEKGSNPTMWDYLISNRPFSIVGL
jgi:hypothetical protein